MKKRLLTGLVILFLTIGSIVLRQFSLYFFDAFSLVIMYGALIEFARIQKQQNKKISLWLLLLVPVAEFAIFAFASGQLILLLNLILALFMVLVLVTEEIAAFAKHRKMTHIEQDPAEVNAHLFDTTKNTMMIFAYPILPLSFLFAINHMGFSVGYLGVILIFVVAMMTDTFAYLIGSAFGKTKFIPEVSPKKSVAGVFGGFLGAILGVVAVFLIIYCTDWLGICSANSKGMFACAMIVIALVGSYANQIGDLIASAYKRRAGVKDFSNIFPGHGGFMDRVDGLMFVSVVVYVVLALMIV